MDFRIIVGSSMEKWHAQALTSMINVEARKNKMLPWDAETLTHSIENGHSLLALKGNQLVGHVCLVVWKNYVEICALIVNPKFRRHGIGTRLLREGVKMAEDLFMKRHVIIMPNEKSYPLSIKAGFDEKRKEYFEPEVWESCLSCKEHKNFPNCHCRPMILQKSCGIEVVRLKPFDHEIIRATAELYCEVWKEPPWNEGFWKVDEVIADMLLQMKNKPAIFLVAICDNQIVGFTWGYEAEKELMRSICGSLILDQFFEKHKACFYVDELATHIHFRYKGIGRKISLVLLGEARSIGQNRFILRTDVKAHAARSLYSKIGFKDLKITDANYPDRTYWLRS